MVHVNRNLYALLHGIVRDGFLNKRKNRLENYLKMFFGVEDNKVEVISKKCNLLLQIHRK